MNEKYQVLNDLNKIKAETRILQQNYETLKEQVSEKSHKIDPMTQSSLDFGKF